jgi:hypothetical protein
MAIYFKTTKELDLKCTFLFLFRKINFNKLRKIIPFNLKLLKMRKMINFR